jgi:hypothetical protein
VPGGSTDYDVVYGGTTFVDGAVSNYKVYAYTVVAVDSNSTQGPYADQVMVRTCPVRDGVLTTSYYWGCADQSYIYGDARVHGVGLAETGTGTIYVWNIPPSATVLQAILYWNVYWGSSPVMTFDGAPLGITYIGTDSFVHSYRAEVGHLFHGNDFYDLAVEGVSDGASLVIVYEDSTTALRSITINDGMDNEGSGTAGQYFDNTYFPYDHNAWVYVWWIVGGGYLLDHERYYYNGAMVGSDSADANAGQWWDNDVIRISGSLIPPEPGEHMCSATIYEFSDSLHWVAAVCIGEVFPAGIDGDGDSMGDIWNLSVSSSKPPASTATIELIAPAGGGRASLGIYDIAGRLVVRLREGYFDAGRHTLTWAGTGEWGRRVSPGVYFVALRAGRQGVSKKLVVLK